ncbi:MAG: BTAD domain-containing putative transcriptional regulator [Candidatus Xenobiia bacterium LiM19]
MALKTQEHDKTFPDKEAVASTDKHSTVIAKITCPRVSEVVIRKRLFDIIDTAREKPVIWIDAPAGSGKTTLIASYLDERKMRSLWYQVDEGDANIAGFFYYMGLAAKKASPHKKDHLPLLTPEYFQSIPSFTKRYFEKLFDRLDVPSLVVFDNYQDVPESSEFHAMAAYGLGMVPEGIQVIILSRREPPKECIRLFANESMYRLYWNDLRFSPEEVEDIISLKGLKFSRNDDLMQHLYQKTEGWAAGIVLFIESIKKENIDYHIIAQLEPREIFDYFTGELFDRADKEIRRFLLLTSFLPKMTARSAERLTGLKTSGQILSSLSHNNYFTERHFHKGAEYQYHPLFRDFLVSRAGEAFSADELSGIKEKAASILEETGYIEDAAKLYIGIRSWEALTELILKHAPNLLAQGRGGTVKEWIERIPEEKKENTPWLLYWSGLCLQGRDPSGSCALYERAFAVFEKTGDTEGTYRAWARLTEAIVHAWTDFTRLDRWIAWLDMKMNAGPSFPSKEAEVDVSVSMAYALTHRQLDHPAIAVWVEKALSLTIHGYDRRLRINALIYASQYYTLMGDAAHTIFVCEELKRIMQEQDNVPALTIQYAFMEAASHAWVHNDAGASLRAVAEAFDCAEKNDIHLWDHILCLLGVHAAMYDSTMPQAEEYLGRFAHSLEILHMDSCHYHYCAAWYHVLAGDIGRAGVHARNALDLALTNGVFFTEICAHHDMAQVLGRTGKFLEARTHLDRLGDMAEKSKSAYFIFTWLIAEAQSAMEQGNAARCTAFLKRALVTGREHCLYSLYYWWEPSVMSRLCAIALEKGIEEDYVKQLIRIRHLKPQKDARSSESWPWPVVIKTLGGFSLYKDGQLMKFSGKIKHKLLVMLKAIVASGEKGITTDLLIDTIWPEAEGDKALQSFKFTLHQLRKLIGQETILLDGGVVMVDPRSCWTDVRSFNEQISITESQPQLRSDASKFLHAAEKALSLYNGEFLAGEEKLSWAVPVRERYKNRFLNLVSRLGAQYEKSSQWDDALKCYRKAIDIYGSNDEFHHAIIRCADKLRQPETVD